MQIDHQRADNFQAELKRHNLRLTQTRRQVLEVLYRATHPLTITQIAQEVESSHFVSVYRTIDALTKANIIKQVPSGFKQRFELGDVFNQHHHHAVCERCGESIEVHSAHVESLLTTLTEQAGLTPTKHYFEMFGICASCEK